MRHLRKLVAELGLEELARRTGYAPSTLQKALRGKVGVQAKQNIQRAVKGAHERRQRAIHAAEARKLSASKLPIGLTREMSVSMIAEKLDRSESQVEGWIDIGGAPPTVLDAAEELLMGRSEIYPLDWDTGKKRSIDDTTWRRLARTMGEVLSTQGSQDGAKIRKAVDAWHAVKYEVRGRVTRATWERIIDELGDFYDLEDVGTNSKERFKKS